MVLPGDAGAKKDVLALCDDHFPLFSGFFPCLLHEAFHALEAVNLYVKPLRGVAAGRGGVQKLVLSTAARTQGTGRLS